MYNHVKVQKTLLGLVLSLLLCLGILGCETDQDNAIEQARQCTDNASQIAISNPSAAATIASSSCEPLIQNIQTPEAGLIGVGIVLLEEQKLSSLTAIETAVNAGTGTVTTSVSYLEFSTQAHVTSILNYAALSADPGSQELASLISMGYYANIIAGGAINPGTTSTQLAGFLGTLSTDATNGPPAAQAILAAKTSACATGPSTLCTDLTNAVGSNTSSYTTILQSVQAYVNAGG